MILEVLIALLLGVTTGIITGLTPGIHVNLVSVIVLSLSPLLLTITSPIVIGVYIISLAIAHTFLDALPSIYLGAPDDSQALTALPGHRLLLQGKGHAALVYTVIGALGTLILSIVLIPLFIPVMKLVASAMEKIIGILLVGIVIVLVARERKKWLPCLIIFLLAGCLGLIVFQIPTLHQPLFPLLSGLFGLSLLMLSLQQKTIIPAQETQTMLTITRKNTVKSISAATGVGFLAAFLPGFGSSQAAIMATAVVGDIGDEGFLSLVGGINTANMLISVATAYALGKARNGAIVIINELVPSINFPAMLLLLGAALVAGGLAAMITIALSKIFSRWITRVNYSAVIITIILFITTLTFYFDSGPGLIILTTATALGILASSWNVAKNHLMGCLILPVILYFLL